MAKDESGSIGSLHEPSQVDLGDDLIEKTAIIPGHRSPEEAAGPTVSKPAEPFSSTSGAPHGVAHAIDDQLQNARILLNEGFPEEAKKILRQIIIADAHHVEARKLLEEIHEMELKQMFGPGEPVVRRSLLSTYDESILSSDSEEIVRLLDRDLHLSLSGAATELSFFSDVKLLEEFGGKLDREIGGSPPDRVDLAIGFIEMGLFPVALRLLQPLVMSAVERDRLNAVALVSYTRIASGESYEAISVLQPVLNDNDIEKSNKTEIFYMMGRALQSLSRHAEAIGWFMQAQENEPGYRDCADRIVRSRSELSSGA